MDLQSLQHGPDGVCAPATQVVRRGSPDRSRFARPPSSAQVGYIRLGPLKGAELGQARVRTGEGLQSKKGKPPGGDPAAPVRRRSCRGAGSATAGVGRYMAIRGVLRQGAPYVQSRRRRCDPGRSGTNHPPGHRTDRGNDAPARARPTD